MEKQSETEICGENCFHEGEKETKEAPVPSDSAQNVMILRVPDLDDIPTCRICYNGPSRERLLKPCKCKGTIEYVHRHCLERWLESTNCETCELCQHHFTTKKTRKSLWEWCRQSETRRDRRNLVGDCTCFAFLTPLGVATFWLCAEGALYYQRVKNSTLETVALVTLAVFLVLAYITWIALCTRYHLMIWSRWRERNWSVRIVDRPSDGSSRASSQESVPAQPVCIKEPLLRPLAQPLPLEALPHPPPEHSPPRYIYTSRVFTV